ncbi:nuclear transport factor 2 family protein [Nocardioides sp. GY 10127]|uniref:nuclear transport factor 2 family protein n=1 Tax=Nocardioides sp. GY 10127 TaxID=2569762 RepID=UPI001458EDD0|nr:nuclear transport factor 2 family protein [Nocardioides sp. GY 10127]
MATTTRFSYAEYLASYNAGDEAATARDFYTEDVVLEAPGLRIEGREQLAGFLAQAHDGVREELVPLAVAEQGDVLLAELDMVFDVSKDVMTPVGPLGPGRAVGRCLASYTLRDERIASFRLAFWPVGQGA